MKKILSIFIAFAMVFTMAIPTFAASVPVVENTNINVSLETFGNIINFFRNLLEKIFTLLNGLFTKNTPPSDKGDNPNDDPGDIPGTNPGDNPSVDPNINNWIENDPNSDIPNGYPVSGPLDKTAITRERTLEIIYDYFPNLDQTIIDYIPNDCNNVKAKYVLNAALHSDNEEVFTYVGINKKENNTTYINVCTDSLVNQAYLNTMLFSMPKVSCAICLKENPYDLLSEEQVVYMVKFAALYTHLEDGKISGDTKETATRGDVIKIFKQAHNYDLNLKGLGDLNTTADKDFVDYICWKFTNSVSRQDFTSNTPTKAEIQFVADLSKICINESNLNYQATK